ncbi:hypothetical protein [Pelagicoccus sp. SDUM812002]|uniref:hypothetical protein n=1 Tax=Pelagicoccus sp. SDUM812002 TaxID=3041266 RepID=UPI00280F6264|nr:hypothetical protein [Pelagicoccus sp. SDUM812002]MDQ8184647.1 hypothetical protein [Pelagicoccus sp. SDUM812002]
MNIKRIIQGAPPLLTGAAALACATTSHAVSYNYTVLDSNIEVGESFDVAFTATFDDEWEVATFAFNVDPLAGLTANGIIAFNEWSVPDPLEEFSFGPPEVGGLGDPFDPLFGGTDVLLATLGFTALSSGSETVLVSGLQNVGQGLALYDYDSDSSELFDIVGSFGVEVNAVPDTRFWGNLPMLLIGMAAIRRRLSP